MTQAWKQWEGQALNGEFLLREYLGGSEDSAVFLIEDPERGVEKVAIKLIPAGTSDADLQFSQWKDAAQLSHPHLIHLFETGRCRLGDRDLLYLVMEYAELDLSRVLSKGPIPPDETRGTLRLVLQTLAYLHGKGFIHGHLKPANIMSVGGQLKLSSDGLCRAGKPCAGWSTPGDYDPPEAESGIYSQAGDVWSLGMVLVELMRQRSPAWVTTDEGDPVLPRTLPAPYYDIARNCLRFDPRRRWTVAEIATRLGMGAIAIPLTAPKAPIGAGPQKAAAKRRYIFPMAVAAVALVGTLAGLKLLNHHRAAPKPDPFHMTRPTAPLTRKPGAKQQSSENTRRSHSALPSVAEPKTATGSVVQGGVRQKVLPDVPQSALNTIRGTVVVTVNVAVDPSGNVVGATLDSPGPSKYFARLALEAAREWKFRPVEVDGRQVSKDWLLQFDFKKTEVEAIPVRTAPHG